LVYILVASGSSEFNTLNFVRGRAYPRATEAGNGQTLLTETFCVGLDLRNKGAGEKSPVSNLKGGVWWRRILSFWKMIGISRSI